MRSPPNKDARNREETELGREEREERVTGRRIAVIGSGISGLTAAYILSRTDEVTVFEADDRLGGHADTHLVPSPRPSGSGRHGVHRLQRADVSAADPAVRELGVATQASEMSMSVSCSGCGVRYAGKRGPAGLGAGVARGGAAPTCGCSPRSRGSTGPPREALASGEAGDLPLGDFLRSGRFSPYFTAHFVAPLVAAVWSCPPGTALRYPAALPVLVPRQPRNAVGLRVAAVADSDRRLPELRRAGRRQAGQGAPGVTGALGAPPP